MVAPPPTRYGIPGQLQRKSAAPAARPAAVAPPPTRFGTPPVQAFVPIQRLSSAPGQRPGTVPVVQRFVPGNLNTLNNDAFTQARVTAGIEQAIAELAPSLGFFEEDDWDAVRNQHGAVFTNAVHDAIYQYGDVKRQWRKAGRIERHAKAFAKGRILGTLTQLQAPFDVDGTACAYKEQAVAEIQKKLPNAQAGEVAEAVRKVDTANGVNNNTKITTIQSISAIEDNTQKKKLQDAITKLAEGQHASSGMGDNGCAIFFKRDGGGVTVTVLGHHYQNNSKKYEVVWAAAGYPKLKLMFPGG